MSANSSIEWTEATKRCSQCGDVKPVEAFARDNTRRDGRAYRCHDCRNGSARATGTGRAVLISRVGKKAAGRELDGVVWDQYPDAPAAQPGGAS